MDTNKLLDLVGKINSRHIILAVIAVLILGAAVICGHIFVFSGSDAPPPSPEEQAQIILQEQALSELDEKYGACKAVQTIELGIFERKTLVRGAFYTTVEHAEFIVAYAEDCPLPNKVCSMETWKDGDGGGVGLSCIPIQE